MPIVQKLFSSHIKDTGHFIEKINNMEKVIRSSRLLTIYTSISYTNITLEESIKALVNALTNESLYYCQNY